MDANSMIASKMVVAMLLMGMQLQQQRFHQHSTAFTCAGCWIFVCEWKKKQNIPQNIEQFIRLQVENDWCPCQAMNSHEYLNLYE